MTARLDPRVAELASAGQYWVREQVDGFALGTSDVHLVVTDDAGTLTVEGFERGASTGVTLVTEHDDVLQRYLVRWIATWWRPTFGLGFWLRAVTGRARQYEVVGDPQGADRQIRRRRDGAIVARGLYPTTAQSLVVTLSRTLDDVVACACDRQGAPLRRRRRLRRSR